MLNIKAIIFLLLGLYLGNKIPDIDQKLSLSFIYHRSLLTHSFIPLFIFYLFLKKSYFQNENLKRVFIGLGYGLALHLSMDLFPKNFNFYDHACIHLPWINIFSLRFATLSLGSFFSPIWILSSIFICLFEVIEKLKTINKKNLLITQIAIFSFAIKLYWYELKPDYILLGLPNPFWGIFSFILIYALVIYYSIYLEKILTLSKQN